MFTLEEINNQGISFVGQGQKPDFIVSSRTDNLSFDRMRTANNIENLLNENLIMTDYSASKIKHLTWIYNVLESTINAVDWKERKYYKRKEKQVRVEIKFPNYSNFVNANKQEALQIMASETLRGTKKFLYKEKDFDGKKFYVDLENLFKENGLI